MVKEMEKKIKLVNYCYNINDVIKDASLCCKRINELYEIVTTKGPLKIETEIDKLILSKMNEILPKMYLKYSNGYLKKIND